MRVKNSGPNIKTIYMYMKTKGYTANYKPTEGKQHIIFTKTVHNPQFPKTKKVEGLVLVHKIQIDVFEGKVQKHWLEPRGIPVTSWEYIHTLEDIYEECIVSYNEIKGWIKKGWIEDYLKTRP